VKTRVVTLEWIVPLSIVPCAKAGATVVSADTVPLAKIPVVTMIAKTNKILKNLRETLCMKNLSFSNNSMRNRLNSVQAIKKH
jgi:hypothetical protein